MRGLGFGEEDVGVVRGTGFGEIDVGVVGGTGCCEEDVGVVLLCYRLCCTWGLRRQDPYFASVMGMEW